MKNKLFKNLLSLTVIIFVFSLVLAPVQFAFADADKTEKMLWGKADGDDGVEKEAIREGMGLKEQADPRVLVARIIRVLLGFMGIVMVVLVFYGGWKWMMSKGDSNEIQSAKDIIKNAVIGLAIVLATYSITEMVIRSLAEVTEKG